MNKDKEREAAKEAAWEFLGINNWRFQIRSVKGQRQVAQGLNAMFDAGYDAASAASAERIETLQALVGRYEAMLKVTETVTLTNDDDIDSKPNGQWTYWESRRSSYLYQDGKPRFFNTALEAFEAGESLGKDATTTTEAESTTGETK